MDRESTDMVQRRVCLVKNVVLCDMFVAKQLILKWRHQLWHVVGETMEGVFINKPPTTT